MNQKYQILESESFNVIKLQKSRVLSMWFWSVSWSTNCPVYFSFFLVDQRKICPVSDLFCSISWIFCPVFFENVVLVSLLADQLSGQFLIFWKRLDNKFKTVNKKDLRLDKIFFGRPKKMRNRPNNWSTKRLTKTTWTYLTCYVEQIWGFLVWVWVFIIVFRIFFIAAELKD